VKGFSAGVTRYPVLVTGMDAEGKPLFMADIWLAISYLSA